MQAETSAKLIDTRSTKEYVMIGPPQGAVHIPWQDDPDWACNPRFTEDIKSLIADGEDKTDGGHSPPIPLDLPLWGTFSRGRQAFDSKRA